MLKSHANNFSTDTIAKLRPYFSQKLFFNVQKSFFLFCLRTKNTYNESSLLTSKKYIVRKNIYFYYNLIINRNNHYNIVVGWVWLGQGHVRQVFDMD
jgi:hypothetical protein